MPRNIAGPVVHGDDLFGRDSFIEQLEAALAHGSVLVSAPRRWGKTSVLQRLVERDASARYYFDLYPLTRASDLVAEIAAATATREDRAGSWVGELLGRTLGQIKEIRFFELAVEL